MTDARDKWAALGRHCATRGMNLKEAHRFFDAYYVAAAITNADGKSGKADDLAGMGRQSLNRMRKRVLRESNIDTEDESC